MEMGSDGSLYRITSSAAEHNNAAIVVSESESEKSKGTPYKIVIIGTIQNPYESSPEVESDEEIDEIVPNKIEPSIGNGEKANTSSDKKIAVNEFKDKGSSKTNRGYRHSSNNNFKSRRPNKPFRTHHNSSNKRNSYPKNNSSINYPNNSSVDIYPWDPNSIMVRNYPSYSNYHQYPVIPPAIESHILNRHNCESSAASMGILGDRPYFPPPPPPPQYPSRDPNVPEQNYWNDPTDNQNYWNDGHSNNYQRPIPTDRPVSEPKNFHRGKRFHQNEYWRRGNAHR